MSCPEEDERLEILWHLVTLQMAHECRVVNGEEADEATARFRRDMYRAAAERGIPIPVIPGGPHWTLH